MYRPKIYAELLPALFETAKSRNLPPTRLANSWVLRALHTEYLPKSAVHLLPNQHNFQPLPGPHNCPTEQSEDLVLPHGLVSRLSRNTTPFSSIREITDWYRESIDGAAKALRLYQNNTHAPCHRTALMLNEEWRYENLAISANHVLVQALANLSAHQKRPHH